jgi:6-phosphogluconolactonase (cycloisomerase 2 family)
MFQLPSRSSKSLLIALLSGAAALAGPSAAGAATRGAVYTETNQPDANQVVVLARGADGGLTVVQRINTGGVGELHNPPFPQDHLDANNEVELTADGKLLFAVNAGDNTVSSFKVGKTGKLTYADKQPTGGEHPVSIDSHKGLLYALNELDPAGHDISGLRYSADGKLTPIPNSIKSLASPFAADNGFGFSAPLADQIIFTPDGKALIVPERTSNSFKGQLDVFPLGSDGTPGTVQVSQSNEFIPFGLAFDTRGHLLVANGGTPLVMPPAAAFAGGGSSYSLSGTSLTPIGGPVSSHALGTCWVVVAKSGKFAYMSDQNSLEISRFRIAKSGKLTLVDNVPTTAPPADIALSADSRYLYGLNVLNANGNHGATIDGWKIRRDGSLEHVLGALDPQIPDSASGLAAF